MILREGAMSQSRVLLIMSNAYTAFYYGPLLSTLCDPVPIRCLLGGYGRLLSGGRVCGGGGAP